MRALVVGWFSFEQMGATAGDLIARDLTCEWLAQAGHAYDVALAAPFEGGVDWRNVDPKGYSHLVFVCGPFGNGEPITSLLARFAGRRLIGLNLSMLDPLDQWNPFELLLERDSSAAARPDIVFLGTLQPVPVVGVVLVHPQAEYKGKARHTAANEAIARLTASRAMARVAIDTRLDINGVGLRTAAEIESLVARMDVVVTTRLHGLVLSIKHGVPVVAVDPIAGGAKIRRQADTIGWPIVLTADALSDQALQQAFDYCLTPEARTKAQESRRHAIELVRQIRDTFIQALATNTVPR
jgi:hypothetical protein